MKSFKQILVLCLFSCLVISGCTYAQDNNKYEISGNIGIEGVVMRGLPGRIVSDSDGYYSTTVSSNWTGKIMPQKEGYVFQPASREYNNITEDKTNQDYKASMITYTISGKTGVSGVRMEGLPGNPITDKNGTYLVIVPYGWTGLVRPEKEGYDFNPPEIRITNINSNQDQNFIAAVRKFEISGNVGIPDVRMIGLPGNLITDSDGSYKVIVDYGWSGLVKPQKSGYFFNPASRTYDGIAEDKTNEDYVSEAEDYTISGTIVSDKGEPVEDVVLTSNGVNPVVTDDKGQYSFEVEYGWSGVIKPEHQAYTFSPALMRYSRVQRDMANQNYKARIRMLTISDTIEVNGKGIPNVKVTVNPGDITTFTDSKGQFSIQVPYGWSGEVLFTSTRPGLDIFSSPGKQYSNVTTDIINGIPIPPTNVTGMLMIPQTNSFQSQMSRSGGRKILIVPLGDINPKQIAETKEDILVMAEILDERFREPRLIEGVLADFGDFFGRDNKQTDAIHIQDYSVIFMMEVNCQFSSLSKSEEKVETRTNSDTDQTWQQARQRVLSPETISSGNRDYEVQMVNILKTELIRTLKYASNIRNIKPDEWVILSVSGVGSRSWPLMGGGSLNSYPSFGGIRPNNSSGGYGSGYGGGAMVEGSYGSGSGYGGGSFSGGYEFGVSSYGVMNTTVTNNQNTSSAASVMTMRVKKSDIDEFANETIDFEQFREKIEILLY